MCRAAIDHVPIAVLPAQDSIGRAPVVPAQCWSVKLPLLRKLALSAAVWMLYVPHLAILKLLGPRFGALWARGLARLHWLLTFLGAQRSVRNILRAVHPQLQTDLSLSSIVRKHLELKHECFARFKLFNRPAEGSSGELTWELDSNMRAKFERAKSSGKGLIIVGYHFGFFRLSASAMPHTFPSSSVVFVKHRFAHYMGHTVAAIADMALQKAFLADKRTGARIHYVDPGSSLVRIYRMLLAGETIALAADGAFARDFVDVPFLGGKLRMPCGWARVAAATGANVLILLDTKVDHRRRRIWIFDHVQVTDKSTEAIYRAVAESARILETFVRREPWAWHPWQRLRCDLADDGSRVLVIKELGTGAGDDRGPAPIDCNRPIKTGHEEWPQPLPENSAAMPNWVNKESQ